MSFAHIGDQINEGEFMVDYAWIDEVKKHHKVDVLLTNNWTNEILRIVQGFNPKLVLPGHQCELGHPIDDRVPYWGDAEFLELVLSDEAERRQQVTIQSRLNQAGFEEECTLERFDWTAEITLDKSRLNELFWTSLHRTQRKRHLHRPGGRRQDLPGLCPGPLRVPRGASSPIHKSGCNAQDSGPIPVR
jgi:hypothetical protein